MPPGTSSTAPCKERRASSRPRAARVARARCKVHRRVGFELAACGQPGRSLIAPDAARALARTCSLGAGHTGFVARLGHFTRVLLATLLLATLSIATVGAYDVLYVHAGHLGTPLAMTDQRAQVVWRADHTPFGTAVDPVTTERNSLRFPGQYFDPETGLHYNYFRYYDPGTERYLQGDPLGLAGGTSRYAYVGASPVGRVDPEGLLFTTVDATCGRDPAFCFEIFGQLTDNARQLAQSRQCGSGARAAAELQGVPGSEVAEALFALAAVAKGRVGRAARRLPSGEKIIFIVKLDDLRHVPRNQTLLDELPDLGTSQANWKQNSSLIRRKLREGYAFRDASKHRRDSDPDPTPFRLDRTVGQSFLGAERNLLDNLGITAR